MPYRKIPRNGRSITGRMARYDGCGSVGHESFLEHDCLLLLLFDPQTAEVEEQPVRINYRAPDRKGVFRERHYIPDFLVTYCGEAAREPLLVEVKYHQQLLEDRETLLPKVKAGQRYAREHGWRFRVFTERHVRGRRTFLNNIKFLSPFRRRPRDEAASRCLLAKLAEGGCASVEDLLKACGAHDTPERGRYIACVWWLVSSFEVEADLEGALGMSSKLRLPK